MVDLIEELEVADGPWTIAEDSIIAALPASPAFQDLMNESGYEEAALHIFHDDDSNPVNEDTYDLLEDQGTLMGVCYVTSPENEPFGLTASEAVGGWNADGRVVVIIRHGFALGNKNTPEKTDRWFKRRIEQTLLDVVAFVRREGSVRLTDVRVNEGPIMAEEPDEDTLGIYNKVVIVLSWETIRSEA